jgi:hypothetical protein
VSRPAARQDRPPFAPAESERLQRAYLATYNDGARCAFTRTFPGAREGSGYPRGFHRWPRDKRDAWLAGFSEGFHYRRRANAESGDG